MGVSFSTWPRLSVLSKRRTHHTVRPLMVVADAIISKQVMQFVWRFRVIKKKTKQCGVSINKRCECVDYASNVNQIMEKLVLEVCVSVCIQKMMVAGELWLSVWSDGSCGLKV